MAVLLAVYYLFWKDVLLAVSNSFPDNCLNKYVVQNKLLVNNLGPIVAAQLD